jgi:large subunit ribosomal protein L15
MSVNQLRAPVGASKKKNIVGRGRSSGSGKTSGKGHKGQKARSGGGVRTGFEGGQMPLYRRVAARGFSNYPFKTEYVVVNLSSLEKLYKDGETVNLETLVQKGLVKKSEKLVKILGVGELKRKLDVNVPAISASAKEKIEKAGGKVIALTAGSEKAE